MCVKQYYIPFRRTSAPRTERSRLNYIIILSFRSRTIFDLAHAFHHRSDANNIKNRAYNAAHTYTMYIYIYIHLYTVLYIYKSALVHSAANYKCALRVCMRVVYISIIRPQWVFFSRENSSTSRRICDFTPLPAHSSTPQPRQRSDARRTMLYYIRTRTIIII